MSKWVCFEDCLQWPGRSIPNKTIKYLDRTDQIEMFDPESVVAKILKLEDGSELCL